MKKLIVIMIIPVFIFACTLTNASAAHVASTPRADPPRVAVPDPVLAGLPISPSLHCIHLHGHCHRAQPSQVSRCLMRCDGLAGSRLPPYRAQRFQRLVSSHYPSRPDRLGQFQLL